MGDKVKRWRQKAVDRDEWVSVIKVAKGLRQPSSEEVITSTNSGISCMYLQFVMFAYTVHTENLRTKESSFGGRNFVIQSQTCFCIPLHTTMAMCHSVTICSRSNWRYFFLWRVRLPLMNLHSCRSSTNLQFPKRPLALSTATFSANLPTMSSRFMRMTESN